MKDAFQNELKVGDFVVYAVGQGQAAGGLRIGRVTPTTSEKKPVFTAFYERHHYEWDNPDEKAFDWNGKPSKDGAYTKWAENYGDRVRRANHTVDDGWQEDSARRIGGFNQVKKIFNTSEIANPELRTFMDSLR